MAKYGKSNPCKPGKAGHGAGKGWGATGPGGDSRSKPVSKGPYATGKATGTKA